MKNRKGATSVLVVFIMIVFVTIGAFMILSANLNLKFSTKVLEWNEDFYLLEKDCEYFIAELDSVLLKSDIETIEYLKSNSGIQDDSELNENKALFSAFEKEYLQMINENINTLKQKYPALVLDENLDLNIDFASKTNQNMLINLQLKILIPQHEFKYNNGLFVERANEKRFLIKAKKEWQNNSVSDNKIDVWNGELS